MPKKILIVDDEVHIVEYLKNIFEDHGYQTVSASDGEQAFAVMRAEKPDLITLDLQMPHEGGTKFYQKFRADSQFKAVPIIVISGQDAPHRSLKPDKVTAIVAKPFDPQELVRIVVQAIGQP